MLLSADDVIFSFVFVHFKSLFTKIFSHIMFISADVVVVTGKLAKIIGILHFNIEMLEFRWLAIIMLGELMWYFMTSDKLMMIVMVMHDCVWSLHLERFC